MNMIKSFLKEEDGMGTIEIVIIIAVLVGVALLFKTQITSFVQKTMDVIIPKEGAGEKVNPY